MKFKLLAGAALAAVFAASGAAAQVGWYGAIDLGYHWPDTTEFDTTAGPTVNIHTQDDWAAFARLGYQVSDHWRVEGELGYRPGDVDSAITRNPSAATFSALCTPNVTRTAAAPSCGSPDGDAKTWSLMANVIYDVLPDSPINPFLGVGVGAARTKLRMTGQVSNVPGVISATNPAFQNIVIDDDDTAFAWQAIAGFAWKATDRLNVDLTYRYLGTSDLNFTSTNAAAGGVQPGAFQGKLRDSSVTLGVRYSFAPPPPPPPPPAYEAKQFIVYFPFDQYILTPEAQAVVTEAANYASGGHATKVVVVGHTDTSGSPAYNTRLSERRAKAVADALVGAGVAQTALSVDWKGETQPAVQTGDGVKEPLNRRSTIDINF